MTLKRSRRTQPLGLTLLLLLSLLIAACGAPAAAPTGGEQAAAPAADAAPAEAAPEGLAEVPRNRTFRLMLGGREGQHIDYELWNPYAIGANHQTGPNIIYEPLAFYSAFADEEVMWLAESYEYNEDSTELTIVTRQGITWSDGQPFSAADVAFTFNELAKIGPAVRWGFDVQQVVESAEAVDENTVLVKPQLHITL